MENNDIIHGFDAFNDNLRFALEWIGGEPRGVILHLDGYVDRYVFDYFNTQMTKVIDSNFNKVIVDCRHLQNESGDGIIGGVLLASSKIKKSNGEIILANVNAKYAAVMEALGILNLVKLADSIEEAMTFLKEK